MIRVRLLRWVRTRLFRLLRFVFVVVRCVVIRRIFRLMGRWLRRILGRLLLRRMVIGIILRMIVRIGVMRRILRVRRLNRLGRRFTRMFVLVMRFTVRVVSLRLVRFRLCVCRLRRRMN